MDSNQASRRPLPQRSSAAPTRTVKASRAAFLGALLAPLWLAGCASQGSLPPHPVVLDGAQLTRSTGSGAMASRTGPGNTANTVNTAASAANQWPAPAWYQAYGDPALDALIARALDGSPSLQAATARLDKAAAQAGVTRAGLYPQLAADGSINRQRLSGNGLYPPPYAGMTLNMNNVQLTGSWDLDLFGQHRAELEAAVGAARAAQVDADAARILLTTQVTRGWFSLARLLEQQRILTDIQGQRRQTVDLVRQRVTTGLDTTVELRQAEGQAFEVDRDLAALDEQIGNTRHALAALIGQGPTALNDANPRWSDTRALAWPREVPADLLGRRADLTAARLRIEAATRGVDAAKATFYPNISLSAFVGLNAIGFSDWMTGSSRAFGIGPAVHLPIFEAGRLRANLRSQNADLDSAIASYNGALVDAVRDVADQLNSLDSLRVQQERQVDVQRATDEAQALATARYKAGLGTFLTVLQALANELIQRRVSNDLKYRVIDTQIALIRALGGGYHADSTPLAARADAR